MRQADRTDECGIGMTPKRYADATKKDAGPVAATTDTGCKRGHQARAQETRREENRVRKIVCGAALRTPRAAI